VVEEEEKSTYGSNKSVVQRILGALMHWRWLAA